MNILILSALKCDIILIIGILMLSFYIKLIKSRGVIR